MNFYSEYRVSFRNLSPENFARCTYTRQKRDSGFVENMNMVHKEYIDVESQACVYKYTTICAYRWIKREKLSITVIEANYMTYVNNSYVSLAENVQFVKMHLHKYYLQSTLQVL